MTALRILLLGKDGQVGFEAQRALAPLGELTALGRTDCDLAAPAALRERVSALAPDVIVNAAAYTAVDRAEQERDAAHAVNALAPEAIGQAARALGALVVHYSTDYVFAGEGSAPHAETDPTGPRSVYGATKLEGEQRLAATGCQHLVFRTSWVYGAWGGNFLKTMLKLGAERDSLRIVGDQHGVPTSAALIADVTAHAIRRALDPQGAPDGIYHLAPAGETTWYDYAQYVFATARALDRPLKVAPDGVSRIATSDYPTPAQRPANSRLSTRKLENTFALRMPEWRAGVAHTLRLLC